MNIRGRIQKRSGEVTLRAKPPGAKWLSKQALPNEYSEINACKNYPSCVRIQALRRDSYRFSSSFPLFAYL